MFRSLLTDRTNHFDTFVRAALIAMTALFALGVLAGIGDLATAPTELADNATVTIEFVSIEALVPDLGGALVNLPVFRL